MEFVAGVKFPTLRFGSDELIEKQVFSNFFEAILGHPADVSPNLNDHAFQEIARVRIMGDALQTSADDGQTEQLVLADSRQNLDDGFDDLNRGDLPDILPGLHSKAGLLYYLCPYSGERQKNSERSPCGFPLHLLTHDCVNFRLTS